MEISTILLILSIFSSIYLINSKNIYKCNGTISINEYEALQSLYFSTNGNNWIWDPDLSYSTRWNFSVFDLSLPCNNDWQGITCKCDKVSYIYQLKLEQKKLNGTLPSNIGGLSNLEQLDLSNNLYINGRIPSSISQMTALVLMILNINSLTSTIPPSLYTMTTLEEFNIQENLMTGTISSNISNLVNLYSFIISYNNFYGSIPKEVWQLDKLNVLYADNNYFNGSLHINLTESKKYFLNELQLYQNELTGSIPSSICNYKSLSYFEIYDNKFTSSLPSCMSTLSELLSISLAYNHFSYIFPPELCYLNNITDLVIAFNYFTGNLCFNYYNSSDESPDKVRYDNIHTSSIFVPNYEYGENLQILYFDNNYLTGAISSNICRFIYLSSINLLYNQLSGSLPNLLGSCLPRIQDFLIQCNLFTGKIPIDLSTLSQLREFLIQNNDFSGDILNRFNSTNQIILSAIDMSSNHLTSSIPSNIFLLPQLQSVILTSNCFTGTLPQTICEANNTLVSLLFDGLSSNSNCPRKSKYLYKAVESISSVFYESGVYGTIPNCLFNMPLLTTLHLSGNLLSGSLPDIHSHSSDMTSNYSFLYHTVVGNLSDLSLSNNRLSGTIPISFQKYNFTQQLLLSNNEFSGTLIDDFTISPTQTALSLSVNRLSGKLPNSFLQPYVSEVSLEVLSGNIFECNQNNLPSNDPDSKSYSCGSENLNTALYSFGLLYLIIVIFMSTILLLYVKSKQYLHEYILKVIDNMKEWLDTISISRDLSISVTNGSVKSSNSFMNPIQTFLNLDRAGNESLDLSTTSLSRDWSSNKFNYLSLYPQILLFIDSLRWIQLITFGIVIYILLVLLPVNLILSSGSSIYTYQYGWVISMVLQHGIFTTTVYMLSIFIILSIVKLFMYGQKLKNMRWLNSLHVSRNDEDTREDVFEHYYYSILKLILIVIFVQSVNAVVTLSVNVAYVQDALRDSQLSYLDILCLQAAIGLFKVTWGMTYIPLGYYLLIRSGNSKLFSIQNRLFMSLVNFIVAPVIATLVSNESCYYYAFNNEPTIDSSFYLPLCPDLIEVEYTSQYLCLNSYLAKLTTTFQPTFLYNYCCGSALLTAYIPVMLYSYITIGLIVPLMRYPILRVKTFVNYYFKFEDNDDALYGFIDGIAVNVTMMQHITVLLTFGISYPLLGLVIGLAIYSEVSYFQLVMGYAIKNKILHHMSRYIDKSWGAINSCSRLIVCTVSLYWSFLFFDMIGDKYGSIYGISISLGYSGFLTLFIIVIIPFSIYKLAIFKESIVYMYEYMIGKYLIVNEVRDVNTVNEKKIQLVSIDSTRQKSTSFGITFDRNLTL